MADINTTTFTGRLTSNPDLKYNDNKTAIARFTVANNVGFGKYEHTNFIRVVCYGKMAEFVTKFAGKGRQVAVMGETRLHSKKQDDGTYVNNVSVIAREITLLGQNSGEATPKEQVQVMNNNASDAYEGAYSADEAEADDSDEAIPF